jgi:GTP-binding protein EngB required for normal cell division
MGYEYIQMNGFASMKIVVLNYSGNVGKSTLCNTLLSPRIEPAKIFRIESVNDSGLSNAEEEKLRGSQFRKLLHDILLVNDAIIDVGTSNVEEFILMMTEYDDAYDDFDYFIVPVLADNKAIKEAQDSIKTIQTLHKIGVPKEKILVVFNRLDKRLELRDEASIIFNFYQKSAIFTLNENAVVYNSELWLGLAKTKQSFYTVINDQTDYKSALAQETDDKKREAIINKWTTQRLARTVEKNMSDVFVELFDQLNFN